MPKLAEMKYCTGCTACACACPKAASTMVSDEDSFRFPVVDPETCISCGLCEKNCPVVTPRENLPKEPTAYAVQSRDEDLRLASSSGGVFSEVAKTVLARGGAVFGAAYNDQFEVVHICAETEGELARLRGAKYAQSHLTDTFSQVKVRLDRGQQVLFSGTPCQVAGLKAFLNRAYENLLTVDFVCHSVPSPMAWQAYIRYRSERDNGGKLPRRINLRAKHTGWSRYRYSNLFDYGNGITHSVVSGDSLYMKLFGGGYLSRESCENCQFKGFGRVSDLTLGDFWGIWEIHPEMDDNKGTSLVLVQSDRGAAILEQIREKLVMKPVTLEEASRQNPAMVKSMAVQEKRQEALEQIRKGGIGVCESWFPAATPSRKPGPLTRMRRILGRIRRKIWK